ncbi:hypothetical protein C8Q73DRAFT_741901 [Cubamyces lactineus]|nr:hypothetical protein C8Q73DRAFT_741901 [Cubamyces lactineus]
MSTTNVAHWYLKMAVAKCFARKMGLEAQVVKCTYKLVVKQVPMVEVIHSLRTGSTIPGQRTAYLMLTLNSVNQAKQAPKGLTLVNRFTGARCQCYSGHFAWECKAVNDVCTNCADAHLTRDCTVANNPCCYQCINCNKSSHAAWDRSYPTLHAKLHMEVHQKTDCGFCFFMTNAFKIWISEKEELSCAPPLPTVWSQIQHHFDTIDSGPTAIQT